MYSSNESVSTVKFLDIIKSAEAKPVVKKKSIIDKENNITISILPVISKSFEILISK